jgi:LPXTG-site transpeptidase (sortase) family protein
MFQSLYTGKNSFILYSFFQDGGLHSRLSHSSIIIDIYLPLRGEPMRRFILRFILCLFILVTSLMSAAASDSTTLELSIPAIDVNVAIINLPLKQFRDGSVTWDTSRLYGTVGHFEGTAWFGEAGRIVLGGHSETTGHKPDVFYRLDQLQIGDTITVNAGDSAITYQDTERTTVTEEDLSILDSQGSEQLVLMTCDISSYEGGGRYSRRVVIIAARI